MNADASSYLAALTTLRALIPELIDPPRSEVHRRSRHREEQDRNHGRINACARVRLPVARDRTVESRA